MSTRQPDLYACLLNAAILKECTIHPFCFYGASTAMDIPLLPDIVAIFCLSIGVLLVCHQVKIPPIVGFLLTGVLCGPTSGSRMSAARMM